MRKLLVSTTALSVAISPLGTMPVFAQVLNGIEIVDRIIEGDVIESVEILP